ncbi:hypothetical protein LSCM1_02745 [Leishmania martiniquensis]|uniref:Uncharacterized protein n=1 Tax=Leishmania martiniquensis TaxID=1580590 RepID=A0A836KEF0_9TRYP|nr:hypothetical protein LSCM1_02745 [Leishmania martiniquensis]
MRDFIPPTRLPASGTNEGAGRVSYAALSSWFRQRLLPTLFPSPASAAMPSLELVSLSPDAQRSAEVTAAAMASLSSAPTRAALSGTEKGRDLTEPTPVSPLPLPVPLAMVASSTESAADAAVMHAQQLPSVLPLRGGGVLPSTTAAVATESAVFADTPPTPGSASLCTATPRLLPSSSLLGTSVKLAESSNAALDKSATAPSSGNDQLGLLSSTPSPFLRPASLSSSFADSRTPPTCVELPGPQSLFIRGSDALGCSGRSPRLLPADSRRGEGSAPPMKL